MLLANEPGKLEHAKDQKEEYRQQYRALDER
jgi:hypothetical protein